MFRNFRRMEKCFRTIINSLRMNHHSMIIWNYLPSVAILGMYPHLFRCRLLTAHNFLRYLFGFRSYVWKRTGNIATVATTWKKKRNAPRLFGNYEGKKRDCTGFINAEIWGKSFFFLVFTNSINIKNSKI